MHRIAALITVLAFAATLITTTAGGSRAASLRLVDRDPLTVQGYGFKARERVRVTVSTPDSPKLAISAAPWRVMRASAHGLLRIVFAEVSVDRCNMVRVVVIRSGSSQVVLKVLPSPLCPPLSSSR